MKRQRLHIRFLTLLLFCLFLLLAVYGCYSIMAYGNRWFSFSLNPRVKEQKERVIAGDIIDVNGLMLAHTAEDGTRQYAQEEEVRRAVVHLVGDPTNNVSNSVESFQTQYLYGFQTSWGELVANLATGTPRRGDTVQLTVDSNLCTRIVRSFQDNPNSSGKNGAAVVVNYRTGAVLAEVSLPNFDPMNITPEVKTNAASPFWNRAIQAVYPPGSTFKIVTTVSALENIANIEDLSFSCLKGSLDFGDHFIDDYGGDAHGDIKLKQAFEESCNKMYATLAINLGGTRLTKTAQSFAFNHNFLFRDLVVENSSFPTSFDKDYILAAAGFGQASITATPMHMCLIAAAIANNGVMMEPRILHRVTGTGGQQRADFQQKAYTTVCTPELADTLQTYMRAVVQQGTGRRANVDGMNICGKTGTADSTANGQSVTYGWFVGFSHNENTPYAVAVIVENIDGKTSGGTTAAPIAKDIFTWIKEKKTGN